jgi:hypothetical protein
VSASGVRGTRFDRGRNRVARDFSISRFSQSFPLDDFARRTSENRALNKSMRRSLPRSGLPCALCQGCHRLAATRHATLIPRPLLPPWAGEGEKVLGDAMVAATGCLHRDKFGGMQPRSIGRSSDASSSPRSWPSENGSGPGTSANRTSSTDRSSQRSRRSRPSSLGVRRDSDASPAGCDAAPIASPACHTSSTPLNNSGSARAVRSELRQTWHGVAHFNPDARPPRRIFDASRLLMFLHAHRRASGTCHPS